MSAFADRHTNTPDAFLCAAQENGAQKKGENARRCAGGLTLDAPILASSHRHNGEVQRVNAGNEEPPRGASSVGKVSIALAAASLAILIGSAPVSRAEPSPMRLDAGSGFWELAFTSNLVAIAKRDLGKTGPQLGLPSRLWCGDFINRVRRKAGLSVVPSRRAIDQAKHGKRLSRPVPGALLITRRRNGAHVDVIVAVHGDGTVTTIGGNVSKRVAERRRPARGIIIKPV